MFNWVGQAEHLCGPDLAVGRQFVTFDLELERLVDGYLGVPWHLGCLPAWFCFYRPSDKASALLDLVLPLDGLELWPSRVSDVLPVHMLFVLLSCDLVALHTPGQHGLGGRAHADGCIFTCWRNKKKCCFFTFIMDLPLLKLCVIFWQYVATRMVLPCIWGRVLLTTVKGPSVYPILRSPQNYRILWACFSLGIRLHLGSSQWLYGCLNELWTKLCLHPTPA